MHSDILTAAINGVDLTAQSYGAARPSRRITLVCLPGGGMQAGYFDLAPGFSFVEKMTAAGYRVLTMDHPGTASNPLPDGHPFLTPWEAADIIAEAVRGWLGGGAVIGIGHSMGGMTLTLMQAHHHLFDGLALLGSNAGGLDWGLTADEKAYIDTPGAFRRDLEPLTLRKFGTPFPRIQGGPGDSSMAFGGETPALTEALRGITCALFAAGGLTGMVRGSFRREVEALTVPLFFAVGDRDIGIPPADIEKDYINATSTELHVSGNTGHNSFAFRSIDTLCARLDHWASTSLTPSELLASSK